LERFESEGGERSTNSPEKKDSTRGALSVMAKISMDETPWRNAKIFDHGLHRWHG